jgi:hypothetical protein
MNHSFIRGSWRAVELRHDVFLVYETLRQHKVTTFGPFYGHDRLEDFLKLRRATCLTELK